MKKILVLLSSFNGANYICEQLDSILLQVGVDVHILVRDDGSVDNTVEILDDYKNKYNNVNYIVGKNIGVKKSFLELIISAPDEYDYYSLSDQDDIWLKDKLESAIKKLKNENQDIPLMYGSSVSLYKEGKEIGRQFENPSQLYLGNFLVKNYFPGCTVVFNNALRRMIAEVSPDNLNEYPLHDHWLALVCTAAGGKVFCDKAPHILYRLHNNLVGDREFIEKIKDNGLLFHSDNRRYKICMELFEYYQKYFSHETKDLVLKVIKYRTSLPDKIRLIKCSKIKPINKIEKLVLNLIILLNKF